jgi:hypothetical protein
MEVNLSPATPALHADKMALPLVDTQSPGAYTPPPPSLLTSSAWQDKWMQYPHQHLLLPVDITKAKLLQVCEEYTSKCPPLFLHC